MVLVTLGLTEFLVVVFSLSSIRWSGAARGAHTLRYGNGENGGREQTHLLSSPSQGKQLLPSDRQPTKRERENRTIPLRSSREIDSFDPVQMQRSSKDGCRSC